MMYVLVGPISNEVLTYYGNVLVHDNKGELEWLFPGIKVIPLPASYVGSPIMNWKDHPEMASIRWPLDKRDFR